MSKRLLVCAGALASFGAALLAFRIAIDDHVGGMPRWSSLLIDFAGAILVFIAVACVIVAIIAGAKSEFIRLSATRKYWLYYTSQVGVSELPELYGQYEDLFGRDLVPVTEFERWIKKNPSIAFRVWRQDKVIPSLSGPKLA